MISKRHCDASTISDMPTFVQTYQAKIDQITTGLGSQARQASVGAFQVAQAKPAAQQPVWQ
jgi:hypothetical protein